MSLNPFYSIQSPAFDIEYLNSYTLKIELSSEALRVAVFENDTLLVLEEYNLEKSKPYPSLTEEIKEIFNQHLFLKANYWSDIQVYIESAFCFSIASDIFDISQVKSYEAIFYPEKLNLNYSNFVISENTYSTGYDVLLNDFFDEIYPSKKIEINTTSKKIIHYQNRKLEKNTCILYFSENHFYVYHCRGKSNRKTIFNIQEYDESELKNVLQYAEKIVLYGKITTFNPIYTKLEQISKEASFGVLPITFKGLTFSADLPAYRFLSILI